MNEADTDNATHPEPATALEPVGADVLFAKVYMRLKAMASRQLRSRRDATLQVDRRWCGQWYDPWTGTWLERVKLDGAIPVPPFSRDLALLAARCPATDLHPN